MMVVVVAFRPEQNSHQSSQAIKKEPRGHPKKPSKHTGSAAEPV